MSISGFSRCACAAVLLVMGWQIAVAQTRPGYFFMQLPRPVPHERINVASEPGNDLGEKLRSCIRRLVPDGGTCDAAALTGRQVAASDPFVGAQGPLRVIFGDAIIEISQTWGIPDDTELEGKGAATVFRLAAGVNGDLLRNSRGAQGNRGIFIHDLTLDATGQTQGGAGNGIRMANVADFTIEHVSVLHTVVHGILLEPGCTRGRLLNNQIEEVLRGSGIRIRGLAKARTGPIEISGNKIAGVQKGSGITVSGETAVAGEVHDLTIAENTITSAAGASIDVGDGSQKVTVSGNRIELKGAAGGSSSTIGILVRAAHDVRVANNVISAEPNARDQAGIAVSTASGDKSAHAAEVTIIENEVSGVNGYGVLIASGSSIHLIRNKVRRSVRADIRVSAMASNVTQEDNDLR